MALPFFNLNHHYRYIHSYAFDTYCIVWYCNAMKMELLFFNKPVLSKLPCLTLLLTNQHITNFNNILNNNTIHYVYFVSFCDVDVFTYYMK